MMEREGKTLRDWSGDQLELKCARKADTVTSCTVVGVLVSKIILFTFKGLLNLFTSRIKCFKVNVFEV